MRIYLDNCSLQRPLDDKRQLRVQLEAEAILAILTLSELGDVDLVSSEVLLFEIERSPLSQRKVLAKEFLATSSVYVELTDDITHRAKALEQDGFKGVDALHVATAEAAHVDYFCTCDDRLLRRAKATAPIIIQVVNPLELAEEILE